MGKNGTFKIVSNSQTVKIAAGTDVTELVGLVTVTVKVPLSLGSITDSTVSVSDCVPVYVSAVSEMDTPSLNHW